MSFLEVRLNIKKAKLQLPFDLSGGSELFQVSLDFNDRRLVGRTGRRTPPPVFFWFGVSPWQFCSGLCCFILYDVCKV